MTKSRRGAPAGNRNAAKPQPGMMIRLYLNAGDIALLDAIIAEDGDAPPTDKERANLARILAYEGIRQQRRSISTPPEPS